MKAHLEEAWRSLLLADRDIKAFQVLREEPEIHSSIVYFHAQQAVEKCLKAVLFSRCIGFERTHDLVKLARLLTDQGIAVDMSEDQLRRLNPFAVAYRYDDLEIEMAPQEDIASVVTDARIWAERQLGNVTRTEG